MYLYYLNFNIFVILMRKLIFFQLQTDFTQISESDFVTEVANADSINHVVVFLTGVQSFPENLGGSGFFYFVYYSFKIFYVILSYRFLNKSSLLNLNFFIE